MQNQTKGNVMTSSDMKKFLVLYLVPASVMEEWSKTDPETRKAAEQKMRGEWKKWMSDHAKMITNTGVGGKTKRVSSNGTSDAKNDIILYSFVEAESHVNWTPDLGPLVKV
jgi:hypothetical protein